MNPRQIPMTLKLGTAQRLKQNIDLMVLKKIASQIMPTV